MTPAGEYADIVRTFRAYTNALWPDSGRCCRETRDGAPKCCYQIADGADLQFTLREIEILDVSRGATVGAFRRWVDPLFGQAAKVFVLDRTIWSPEAILAETNDGFLADTLECAAHPTRPVVISGRVVAVVAVLDCNTAISKYDEMAGVLRPLWQRAVDLLGMKPYYVTERLDDGLMLL